MNNMSGITTGTPSKIPFGVGVFFTGVTYDEKVAPTEEEIKAAIIGATQDGGNCTITPELFSPELDGRLVAVKELQTKISETAVIEASFAELTPDLVAKQVIGKKNVTTDGKYDVITSSNIDKDHFYKGFGYCGKHLDGRPLIILFKNALCTSGHTLEAKNKTNSVFKGTIECQSDIEYGVDRLPYAIFIRKLEGWEPVEPEEVEVKEEEQ